MLQETSQTKGPRIAVVGAGIIGMCSALALAEGGATVTIFDRRLPGRGASWAAAGMLAPAFEAVAEQDVHARLFELCLESAELWKSFAPRLQDWTDRTLGYGRSGALACAVTEEQGGRLMALAEACEARGVVHNRLETQDVLKLEPSLSADVMGALELPTDQQIDNWAVLSALEEGLQRAGVEIRSGLDIHAIEGEPGDLRLDVAPGEVFDQVLWTTGQAARLPLLVNGEDAFLVKEGVLEPVKGQMFSLAPSAMSPRRVLRFGSGYVAPKSSRIVVGATVEWGRDDNQAELDVITDLRREAARVCPVLDSGEIMHIWAGVRPGTADHAPLIGPTAYPGIFLATGHYRNGILLAPITARMVADALLEGRGNELAQAFSPARFQSES